MATEVSTVFEGVQADTSHRTASRHWVQWVIGIVLFVAAVVPRVSTTVALTTDEVAHWRGRVENFVAALETGHLENTAQTYHPGVMTMWQGAVGLELDRILHEPDFRDSNTVGYFGMLRLPLAIFSSLCCVFAYFLLRRLFNPAIALLGALFWIFDPFFIAHSQLLHTDASVSELAFLTLLVALVGLGLDYGGRPQADQIVVRRGWWLLAAVLLSLTVLAKINGVIIGGIIGLLVLLQHREQWLDGRWWLRYIRVMAVFGIMALVSFIVAYPAMWVAPLATITGMFGAASEVADAGHLQFFMGKSTEDPGLFFYPVTTAFRITPFVSLGLVLAVVAFFSADMRRFRSVLSGVLLYIAVFTLFTTLEPKKADRYLLSIFPALDLLSGMGYVWLAGVVARRLNLSAEARRPLTIGAFAVAAVALSIPVISSAPYTLDYYNPLLGGIQAATKIIVVGWGEGLNQAGDFITQHSDGNCKYVIAQYSDNMQPYVPCETVSPGQCVYGYVARNPDDIYSVVYINHIQREVPQPLYDAAHDAEPLDTIRINGVDFAYVYAVKDLDLDMLRRAGRQC